MEEEETTYTNHVHPDMGYYEVRIESARAGTSPAMT